MAKDINDVPIVSSPDRYVALKDGHLVTVTAIDAAGSIDSMDDVPGLTDALNAISNSVTEVVGAAPSTLSTLEEIAAAINNDPSFYSTVPPFSQGAGGDSLASVHSNDGSHSISQISGLQDALDAADTPAATNVEITDGTGTDQRTVSPAQIKLAVETFAPIPSAVSNEDITAGTSTVSKTVSAAQVKLAVDTFAPAHVPVTSVAGRDGAVSLTLDDAADSSASSGRLAITTAEAGLLRTTAQATIVGREAAAGTGAVSALTPTQVVTILPAATSGSDGKMLAADKAKIDSVNAANEILIGTFTTGNSTLTFTDMPATVKNPAHSGVGIVSASLRDVSTVRVRGTVSTAGISTARFALKFSVGLSSYSWVMSNGDTAPSDGASAPDSTTATNWAAWSFSTGGSAGFTVDIPVPAACQAVDSSSIWLISWGGDGATDPVLASMRVFIPSGAYLPGVGVAAATNSEITTGTETATRTVSPAQIKLAVDTFAPTGPHAASDAEIAAGTLTTTSTVSPKQVKDAVTAFAPVPTAATDGEISAGTGTDTRTVSPKQIKDAVVAHTPAPANMANATIKGRITSGTGAPEDLTVSQVQSLLALPPDTATRLAFTTYNGIVDTSAQTLSYNVSTKTFTVTRTSDYDVWVGGTKITITATKTVVHADTATTYYIYFDASGTLIASTTKWAYNGNNAPVAVLTYSSFGAVGIWCDCRFPYRRSYHEWEFQDNQVGAWLDNGYAPTFGITDGSVSVSAGRHVLNGLAYSTSSATTTVNVLRRRTDLSWNQNSTAGSDIRLVVSSTLNYDNNGTQANVTLDYYVNVWLFMLGGTLYSVAGQTQYSTQASAESASVDNVSLPGSIAAAGRLIARVTYQRTSTTPSGVYVSYADLRRSKVIGGVTISSGSGGGGASAAAATDDEVIAGTGTTTRTVSPAQMKLAVTTHTTVPVAATNIEITTGTSTSTRTVSAAQVKLAVDTFAPVQAADTEWRAYDVPLQNSVTKATGITQNALFYAHGQANTARSTINAVGLTQFQLRFMVTTGVATRFGLIECSSDGGTTWVLPDGSTVTQAHMAALNPVVLSSATSYNDASTASSPAAQTYSLAAGLRVAKLMYRPIFYDTAAAPTDLVCNRCEFLIQGAGITVASSSGAVSTVFGRNGIVVATAGDYTAGQISDDQQPRGVGSRVIMTHPERTDVSRASRRGRSPYDYLPRMKLNLTRDFGSNNLTADGVPDGSSGTDNRAKLILIRDYLRSNYADQKVELIIPRGIISVSGAVNWNLQDIETVFIGQGIEDSGFVNTKSTNSAFTNSALNFGSTTNDSLQLYNIWRLAEGVDGTANMKLGDDAFIASVSADYNAVVVGDWLTFVSGWYYRDGTRVSDGSVVWGAARRFTARVVSKGSGGRINLDRTFPFDFNNLTSSTDNSGVYIRKRSDGTLISGNAFARFLETTPDPAIYSADTSIDNTNAINSGSTKSHWHARVSLINMLYGNVAGHLTQGGLPLDSIWDTVKMTGTDYAVYGNAMQNCYFREITAINGDGLGELGVCSTQNVFEDIRWIFSGTNGGTGNAWLWRDGECGYGNMFRRIQLLAGDKTSSANVTSTSDAAILQCFLASASTWKEIYAEVGFNTSRWRAFYTSNSNSDEMFGVGNVFEDIYVKYTNAYAHSNGPNLVGSGSAARRIKITGVSGVTVGGPAIVTSADNCTLEDIDIIGTPAAAVQSGCTKCTVRRYNGSVTNSGTGTTLVNNGAGKARLGKFFAGL